ncbi:MAG: hypothetical protein J6C82_02020 [Clostridia bacterium]|nr:hypothetical protein [Clostridia bacterium]
MKNYLKPEVSICRFSVEDIITTSGMTTKDVEALLGDAGIPAEKAVALDAASLLVD